MIVIPTYNERQNVTKLVEAIRRNVGTVPIFFIDDSSPDGTAEEIEQLMRTDPDISLHKRPQKMGLGSAYREAFKKILAEGKAKYIVTMDADFSHPPESLPQLIAALQDNDVAIGSRYVPGGNISNWKFLRRLLSRCSNIYARLLTGLGVKDATAGLVAYKTESLKNIDLDSIKSDGYAFQIELKYRLAQTRARFYELPIVFKERANGKSKLNRTIIIEAALLPFRFLLRDSAFRSLLFVFFTSLIAYILTLPRTIFVNDNAEFITAASVLGIPHPSGYPLYVLLSWMFAHLSFGNLVFSVNLFSSVCASLSLVVLTLIIRQATGDTSKYGAWYASLCALILGFIPSFWFQAIVAKVYTLNLFLILLLAYVTIAYIRTKKDSLIYWFSGIAGLALANHLMSALIVPFLALVFLNKRIIAPRSLGKALLLFLAGLSIYLYLPLRAEFKPLLNWGDVDRGASFVIRHITRAQYADIGGGTLNDKIRLFGNFTNDTAREFSLLLIPFVIGIFFLALRKRKVFLILTSVVFANTVLIIILRASPYSEETAEYFAQYYLPAYAMITVFLAAGLYSIGLRLEKVKGLSLMLTVAAAGFLLFTNFPKRDFSELRFIEEYVKQGLLSLPQDSVLIFGSENAAEDTTLFAIAYHQYAHRLRPDVQVISYVDVFPQKNNAVVNEAYKNSNPLQRHDSLVAYALSEYASRPVFSTFIYNSNGPCVCAPNGYLFQISGEEQTNTTPPIVPSAADERILSDNYFGKQVLANYHYQAGSYFLLRDKPQAERHLLQAISYDHDALGWQFQEYVRFRESKKQ